MEGSSDFPLISDRDREWAEEEVAEGGPVRSHEIMYEELEPWVKGKSIGHLWLFGMPAGKGMFDSVAVFSFDDGHTLVAVGTIPAVEGTATTNKLGGTGRFTRETGELNVEVRNPKRWG